MLQIRIEREADTSLLICLGRLIAGEECRLLWRTVVFEEASQIILDFKALGGMDAAGLGTLAALHNKLVERNRSLIFANVEPRISRLLALTRLDTVLNLRENINRETRGHSCPGNSMSMSVLPLSSFPSARQREF
jgi:anti-anti-sigma factor